MLVLFVCLYSVGRSVSGPGSIVSTFWTVVTKVKSLAVLEYVIILSAFEMLFACFQCYEDSLFPALGFAAVATCMVIDTENYNIWKEKYTEIGSIWLVNFFPTPLFRVPILPQEMWNNIAFSQMVGFGSSIMSLYKARLRSFHIPSSVCLLGPPLHRFIKKKLCAVCNLHGTVC